MKTLVLFLLVTATFVACVQTGKPTAAQVAAAQKIAGQYQGLTPCADCEGIEYLLTLNSDFTYLGAMIYRGKDDQPFPLTGKWSFTAPNRIQLDVAPPAGMNQFEIGENQLVLLDQQGQRITGELADRYILWKEGFAPAQPEGGDDPFATRSEAGVDFLGTGTEPFWALELDFDHRFGFYPMSSDTIETPPVLGTVQDGALTYEATTEAGQFKVTIRRETCSDGMSDREYEYSVVAKVKGQEYKGCGVLLAGSLGSHWTLQSINGSEPDGKAFAKGLPTLQISQLDNKYAGNDGCNSLHGTVTRDRMKIKFNPPVMTRMACPGDASARYLETLLAVTEYRLESKKLTLLVGDRPVLVYGLRW